MSHVCVQGVHQCWSLQNDAHSGMAMAVDSPLVALRQAEPAFEIQIVPDLLELILPNEEPRQKAEHHQDHFARLLDTENFKVLHEFQHRADVNGVVLSNDNKTLLTGRGDAAIRVFDVASSNEIRKLEGHTQGSVTDLDFSPDAKFLASGGMDHTVRIWDLVDISKDRNRRPRSAATMILSSASPFLRTGNGWPPSAGTIRSSFWTSRLWKKNGRGSGDF